MRVESVDFSPFPFVADDDEARQMREWIADIASDGRIGKAVQTWTDARMAIGRATKTQKYLGMSDPRKHLPFVEFDSAGNPKGIIELQQFVLSAVLFLAVRFRLRPEVALTAWVIEGLGHPLIEKAESTPFPDDASWETIPVKYSFYCSRSPGKILQGTRPLDEAEARRFARSIVLFERWGLDALTPCKFFEEHHDNRLLVRDGAGHDRAFEQGLRGFPYGTQMPSPLDWLSDASGPIEVQEFRGEWQYRVHPLRFQPVALWLLSRKIADQYGWVRRMEVGGVKLDPPFDALLYIFHNALNPKRTVTAIVNNVRKYGNPKVRSSAKLDGKTLYELFVSTPVPDNVIERVEKSGRPYTASAYLNALRFEFMRRAYSELFKGIPPPR